MRTPRKIRLPKPMGRVFSIMTLAGLMCAATGAEAEIIKKDDMLRGITTTRAQCVAQSQAVWLGVDGQDFCVRYYVSTAGGEGSRPVVFLTGDYFGSVNTNTWQWVDPAKNKNLHVTFEPMEKDIDTGDLMKTADAFSKMARTTAIYLARIGIDGTSGNHVSRKTALELHLMNAALNAIKQRHGFEGFHLAGQSGGSRLVGGLVGLRHDIACAVSGSGPLAASYRTNFTDPGRSYFDVLQAVPSIAQNRSLRLMLVTDPRDQTVVLDQQSGFVEKMRQAGRPIPQFLVEATDEHHHGVRAYTQLVVAGCVLGKSDTEIATAVGTLVKRNTEYNERKRREAALTVATRSVPPQAPDTKPRREASIPSK